MTSERLLTRFLPNLNGWPEAYWERCLDWLLKQRCLLWVMLYLAPLVYSWWELEAISTVLSTSLLRIQDSLWTCWPNILVRKNCSRGGFSKPSKDPLNVKFLCCIISSRRTFARICKCEIVLSSSSRAVWASIALLIDVGRARWLG